MPTTAPLALLLISRLIFSVLAITNHYPISRVQTPIQSHLSMSRDDVTDDPAPGGKVVVVGSINQDLTTYASTLPKPGETLLGTDFIISAGGKGANQAVAAASIGIVHERSGVYMIGRVGNDVMGTNLLKGLASRNIHIGDGEPHESIVSGTHTGVASIVVDSNGQNTIVVSPGANLKLTPEEVSSSLTRLLSDVNKERNVVLVQLEIDPDAALQALKTAKEMGARSILNPAPAPKGWVLSNDWFSAVDILVPNECELASLCDSFSGEGEEAMAKSLLDRGVNEVVIVTLGARGAMVVTRSQTTMIHEPDGLPCQSEPVIDAVGAGDAFCGALAAYLSRGIDLEGAASMACGVASMSVRKRGAQESYPREDELPNCLRLGTEIKRINQRQRTITFVTGNKNKLDEVQRLLNASADLPFVIESAKIDLPELQGSPEDIALEKCRLASQQLLRPCMIEDTSLCFNDLNDLPGPYIKWFLDGIGHEGLNKMLDGFKGERDAYAQTIIAFCAEPGTNVELFHGRTDGTIVRPRGPNSFGWDPIFEPNGGGGKTYAEMSKEEKNRISHRGKAFQKFREYLSNVGDAV